MGKNLKVGDKVKIKMNGKVGVIDEISRGEEYPYDVCFGVGSYYQFQAVELEKIESEPSA